MTAVAGRDCMRALERETRAIMSLDHALCTPSHLAVARAAFLPQLAVMRVLVTANATLGLEDSYRSTVVVTA